MARRQRLRRVISFVGNTDLRAAGIPLLKQPARENDDGPIWRFISRQIQDGELGDGDCILLLDDKPENGERNNYGAWLRTQVAGSGKSMQIDVMRLSLRNKPTNLNLLFREAFKAIPEEDRFESQLLVSPGTPAMYATLVLAAEYLKLKKPRVFESSPEEGVVEIQLPYDIGLRPHQRSTRAPNARPKPASRLPDLLPHTCVGDSGVRSTYQSLYNKTRLPNPWALLLYGTTGSGKTHAGRQFAHWRGCDAPSIVDAANPPTLDALAGIDTVLIRNLQSARTSWESWRQLVEALPSQQFVFLWRTDADSDACIDQAVKLGLAPGGAFRISGLDERDDPIALVECFARREDMWDGKAKERFQYPLMKRDLPRNLHELESWVNTAVAHSDSKHVSELAVERATLQHQTLLAQGLLQRLARVVVDQSFVGRVPLDSILKCAEGLSVMVQEGTGEKQVAIAKRLGVKRSTLFDAESISGRERALRQVLDAWPEWPRLAT